jgi:hypothetical protein
MISEMVDKIAQAVLYEGYLLYPYRPSAIKNQQRWNFGVLYPPAWAALQTGSDRSSFRMECLANCDGKAELDVSVRFLQLVTRRATDRTWQEAVEQRIAAPVGTCGQLADTPFAEGFPFTGGDARVEARISISATQLADRIFRIGIEVQNTTSCEPATRDIAVMYSLASAHAALHLKTGQFVSQTDPPEDMRDLAAGCQNTGVWPVLVGDEGARDTMLGSPIILYDFPQIAPESKGDLFDATEIDEILTLRILTLTDEEKRELRASDPRARSILERLESTPPEHLLELHGVIRRMRPTQGDAWSAWDTVDYKPAQTIKVGGIELRKGDRVRLRPRNRADIFDTFLEGKTAIIEGIEEDLENRIQLAVLVEDDPGRDLGEMRQIGHRFFFSIEEVEPLTSERIAS